MTAGNSRAGRTERAGKFIKVDSDRGGYMTFVPKSLPPDPALEIDVSLQRLLDQANQALGRLDGITLLLPDPDQFLYTYIRKEAVLSSQIEGTQSSLSDLLLFEHDVAPGVPLEDVQETTNYIAALNLGLSRINEGLPLSLRILKETHGVLLQGTRGSNTGRGEFRRVQNWLGGASPESARYAGGAGLHGCPGAVPAR
jgi:Fic family protein